MKLTLTYTMATGRGERQLDSEVELASAVRDLAAAGAGNIAIELPGQDTPASAVVGASPPGRQIDPSSHSISLVDVRRPGQPIIYVNRGFEHLTGYTREECVGHNCRFLQGPDTDRSAVDRIRRAIDLGEDLIVDLLNYRKNGSTFWNRLSLKPVRNSGGELTHIIGIQSDISQMLGLQSTVEEWARDLGA